MLALLASLLGIGFILWIHELGHYLAARSAGVRVDVFSLGFGPRLLGWRRRGCDFRLSLVPLGGYVKMAGEEGGSGEPAPDELPSKSVGQRFLIFAGGILMNFLFAVLMFPALFRAGVEFRAPVAGSVAPGQPAWEAGIREGDRVKKVDGKPIHSFDRFAAGVALAPAGAPVRLEIESRDGTVRELAVQPRYDEQLGFSQIGVRPGIAPGFELELRPGSAAEKAGLLTGDRVLAISGIPLRDARNRAPTAAFEVAYETALLQGAPLALRVERAGEVIERTVMPEPVTGELPVQFGLRRIADVVERVREGAPAPLSQLLPGDRLVGLNGEGSLGAGPLLALAFAKDQVLSLSVERGGSLHEFVAPVPLEPSLLLSELILGDSQEQGVRIGIAPDGPAARAGITPGDIVLRVGARAVRDFAELSAALRAADGEVQLTYLSPGRESPTTVELLAEPLAQSEYGIALKAHMELVQRRSVLGAVALGLQEARAQARELFATLRGMVTGSMGSQSVGGIITIGAITHDLAGQGIGRLLFFLALLSLHLGILNLLPIPVLDGGHLLFLLAEAVRGRPLDVRLQNAFTLLGLVLVLSLILFITVIDIQRWFFG